MPAVHYFADPPEVEHALRAFADDDGLMLLDSALVRGAIGRYSFLVADPFERGSLRQVQYGDDPFASVRALTARWATRHVDGLPPFQGGVAGLMAYELGAAWERIPPARHHELATPVWSWGAYDWVLAWDHVARTAMVISQGWPEQNAADRQRRAAERVRYVLSRLAGPVPSPRILPVGTPQTWSAPLWPVATRTNVRSDFSREAYLQAVRRVVEYIRAGDIFQANLSQRWQLPLTMPAVDLYARLRVCNPGPFAGYWQNEATAVMSASPERFLQLQANGLVETRPIKGTRRRKPAPEADLYTKDELRESDKDRAENIMIVDLLRNDLSRVCQPGKVRVPQLCAIETYETVQHLVSVVQAQLDPERSVWDLFAATFPGGSITGAPKVRAMQIVPELEPTTRGPYTGSLFYVGFSGAADSNLLIRTFVASGGWLHLGIGGGVVADSDPAGEYEETLHKAAGMLRAI